MKYIQCNFKNVFLYVLKCVWRGFLNVKISCQELCKKKKACNRVLYNFICLSRIYEHTIVYREVVAEIHLNPLSLCRRQTSANRECKSLQCSKNINGQFISSEEIPSFSSRKIKGVPHMFCYRHCRALCTGWQNKNTCMRLNKDSNHVQKCSSKCFQFHVFGDEMVLMCGFVQCCNC